MNRFLALIKKLLPAEPDPRIKLTLKDMPKYKGEIEYLVGETRNHYPDHSESRYQKGASQ